MQQYCKREQHRYAFSKRVKSLRARRHLAKRRDVMHCRIRRLSRDGMLRHQSARLAKRNELNGAKPVQVAEKPNGLLAKAAPIVEDQFATGGLHEEMVGPEGLEPPTKRL